MSQDSRGELVSLARLADQLAAALATANDPPVGCHAMAEALRVRLAMLVTGARLA